MPSGVPKAIVNTGTPASAASWAPTSVVGARRSSRRRSAGRSRRARRLARRRRVAAVVAVSASASCVSRLAPVARASPMAVDSASSRSSMPSSRRSRSSVGAPRRSPLPLNEIRPTSTSGVDLVDEVAGRLLGGVEPVGSTSVAIIDSDTSNSTRMRPRSRCARSSRRSAGRSRPRRRPGRASCSRRRRGGASPAGEGRPVEQLDLGEPHLVARAASAGRRRRRRRAPATASSHHSRSGLRNSDHAILPAHRLSTWALTAWRRLRGRG